MGRTPPPPKKGKLTGDKKHTPQNRQNSPVKQKGKKGVQGNRGRRTNPPKQEKQNKDSKLTEANILPESKLGWGERGGGEQPKKVTV